MASRRTLNARNLEALGASVLAELLIEVSGGNALIQRRLRLALAAAEGADGAAQEVRKRLAAIDRATTYVDARKRKDLISDLETQLQAITGTIAAVDPKQAFDLLLRFLELSEGVLERCSDGTGAVVGVFERAAQQLGPLAQAARLTPEALAEHAAELLAENSHDQFDALVPALKEALGDWGLKLLEAYCRQRGAQDGHPDLVQIALARGDMEAYLAHFSAEDLSWSDVATEVAGQLLRAGRAEQALTILEGATQDGPDLGGDAWDSTWIDTTIAALDALGRSGEAQEARWTWFCESLSIPHLREHLKRLAAFEDVEVEEQALDLAEQHPDSLQALEFLVDWPSLARAARHVLLHQRDWDGDAEAIHAKAAERLSADHPLAATLLLRPVVSFAVWMGRAQRYRQAVDHLRNCEQLASRIDDWQGHPDHQTYVDRLHDVFEHRRGFWKLVT